MSSRVLCPHEDDLRKLASGDITLDNLDTLTEHVEVCQSCLAKVQKMSHVDPLVRALANASPLVGDPDGDFISDLIGKLKKIPASTATAGEQTAHLRSGQSNSAPSQAMLDISVAEDDDPIDFLAPALEADELGRLGPYRVLEVIAQGGMGVVFRAEDPILMRIVALKVIRPSLAASTHAKKRFFREARIAANIRHDHIVTIHQVGEDRGVPYLAMEYLHGESLESRLRRERKLSAGEAIRIAGQIAAGLSAAHVKGLIHRDIKPANIWLEEPAQGSTELRVKILDFGLARGADDAAGLTHAGAVIGTPAYMSPEQAGGRDIDARADLFSLGSVLYSMATGQPPFRAANSIATLMAICTSDAIPPRTLDQSIPQPLSDFIMRMLAKSPAHRPASSDAVVSELLALEEEVGKESANASDRGESRVKSLANQASMNVARSASPPEVSRHRPRRMWPALAGFGAIGVLVTLGVVFFLPTPRGAIRVEVNDDEIEVVLTKTGAKIKGAAAPHEIAVSPGEYGMKVKRGDLEFETKSFVLKNGDTVTVRVDFLADKLQAAAGGTIIGERQIAAPLARTAALDPSAPARFALRLDMVVDEDRAIVPVPKLRLPPTGPITVEAYVNVLDSRNNGPHPVYFGSPYQFWIEPQSFGWHVKTDKPRREREDFDSGSIPLPEQKSRTWVHYAAVRDGAEHRVYIDGVLVGAKKESRALHEGDHVGEVDIGRLVNGTALKEFRVSTTARYRDNFTPEQRFSRDNATLALFHLDEGEGDVARDSSGNGFHTPLSGDFATWMRLDEPFERLTISPNTTWTPSAEQQAYLNSTQRLTPHERVASVVRKLQEINHVSRFSPPMPIFEPHDGLPTRCQINERHVAHLWPLAALTTLKNLDVWNTTAIDYAPLTRLRLIEIRAPLIVDNVAGEKSLQSIATLRTFNDQPASKAWEDRAAIRKEIDKMAKASDALSIEVRMIWFAAVMKKLHPSCTNGFLGNQAPVEGSFGLYFVNGRTRLGCLAISPDVFDLSPTRALGVDEIDLRHGRFFDLTPMAKMKLRKLALHSNDAVRDLSPLAGLPLVHLDLRLSFVSDLRPVAGMKLETFMGLLAPIADLTPLKGMPLRKLILRETLVSDLSPIADITTLTSLDIFRTPVKDLTPISKMRLESAVLSREIADLKILKGMPLTHLEVEGPAIADLSPLKGMALKLLWCKDGRPNDLAPLTGMPLLDLSIDFVPERDAAVLRSLKSIRRINDRPAKEVLNSLP